MKNGKHFQEPRKEIVRKNQKEYAKKTKVSDNKGESDYYMKDSLEDEAKKEFLEGMVIVRTWSLGVENSLAWCE
ncbi:unnamed protein product [Sphenostylis stenocarpa]|uniref:Uncharacterized protein n=1 Tax=Sphenostylis stenocarpa TaxID=92480 RepID=A0AA86S9A4_9FABA|nr:unnamed protein product [Sphenostylis stenocarpa]